MLAVACGGGGSDSTGVEGLVSLKGETIGLVALDGPASLELRYVLQEGAGVNSKALGGDVRYMEAPGDSLPDLLQNGDVAAAVLPPQVAHSLQDDNRYQIQARVAAAMGDLTGAPVMATALLTYRDEANTNPTSLGEARRMLRDSTSYFMANQTEALDAIAQDGELDDEFARWQAERQRIVLGDASEAIEASLVALWDAAVLTGDIAEAPVLDDVLFREGAADEVGGGRKTVSIAVLDDAIHRAALYAIEQGTVESALVDMDVTYLSPGGLQQAIEAREYDIVEAMPLLVVTGTSRRLDLVVLSGGVQDLDSTILFSYSTGE